MAYGAAPVKNANDGAPNIGLKLTDRQRFDYHLPGQTYTIYEAVLVGCHPGLLMARLDSAVLPMPGDTGMAGRGIRAPKAPPKAKGARSKGKATPATDPSVIEGEPDEILAEPTDQRNRKALAAGYKSAYVSPDDPKLLICPAENLTGMFIEAAKCWPGTGLARACGAAIMIEACDGSDVIPFLDLTTGKPLRFDGNVRVVEHTVSLRNPPPAKVLTFLYKAKSSTGKRILTARTYLPSWQLRFRLAFDTSIFQADKVDPIEVFRLNVLAYAGGYIGLGSWRPAAPKGPGPFGRFQLQSFELVK